MKAMVNKTGSCDLLKGKIMAAMFYEVSTRTSSSFVSAMQRLGGDVVLMNKESSSVMKGESLEGIWTYCVINHVLIFMSTDTIRMMQAYCDIIVLRHPTPGSAEVHIKLLFYDCSCLCCLCFRLLVV